MQPFGDQSTDGSIGICLFCGASNGHERWHAKVAEGFGRAVAGEGWRLVFGAGGTGLMGSAARAALAAGGEVCGVIPRHLEDLELTLAGLSELVVTEGMHDRKRIMFERSDAVVVLPGGVGTLDEFFEVMTWRCLSMHDKPIRILNSGGYWDALLELLAAVTRAGFATQEIDGVFSVDESVEGLIGGLRSDLAERMRVTL